MNDFDSRVKELHDKFAKEVMGHTLEEVAQALVNLMCITTLTIYDNDPSLQQAGSIEEFVNYMVGDVSNRLDERSQAAIKVYKKRKGSKDDK